jgi:hypothetical protein
MEAKLKGLRSLQGALAIGLSLFAFLVPFSLAVDERREAFVLSVGVFSAIGFGLVILGGYLVVQARANNTGREAALIRSSAGWLWVGVGLVLIAVEMALYAYLTFASIGWG